jgi:hypothetical protein
MSNDQFNKFDQYLMLMPLCFSGKCLQSRTKCFGSNVSTVYQCAGWIGGSWKIEDKMDEWMQRG